MFFPERRFLKNSPCFFLTKNLKGLLGIVFCFFSRLVVAANFSAFGVNLVFMFAPLLVFPPKLE